MVMVSERLIHRLLIGAREALQEAESLETAVYQYERLIATVDRLVTWSRRHERFDLVVRAQRERRAGWRELRLYTEAVLHEVDHDTAEDQTEGLGRAVDLLTAPWPQEES